MRDSVREVNGLLPHPDLHSFLADRHHLLGLLLAESVGIKMFQLIMKIFELTKKLFELTKKVFKLTKKIYKLTKKL